MKAPELPQEEAERIEALDQTGLLDTCPEERFDRFTRMACKVFKVPIALVSLVDSNRQWFKSCQGLSDRETARNVSFCAHTILGAEILVIEDALRDERFCDNPLVTHEPFIRFYAGAPLHSNKGYRLGTLCVIDREPRTFNKNDRALLRDLANCVEREMDLQATEDLYRKIKRNERKARAVIEGTQIGTWEWNVQTGETWFNERWANICGYKLEELEPVSIETWLRLAHPGDLEESGRLLNAHFSGQLSEYDYRCRMKHKDGHWVWVHDRGQVLDWTEDGLPLMMYGTHADVTAEMDNLHRIEQQNTALGILNELALDPESNDTQRIKKALALGSEYLRLPLGVVSEVNDNIYSVRWFVAPKEPAFNSMTRFPLEDMFCSMLVNGQRRSLAIAHVAISEYRQHRCYGKFNLESYIGTPIYIRDRLYGTLSFSSFKPRPKEFTDTEITFVTLLARWIAGLIERGLSVKMLTKLVEQTPGMLYQYRQWPDGRSAIPFSSPHIKQIFGVDSEDVKEDASVCFSQVHPDDLPQLANTIKRSALDNTVWQCSYRVGDHESGWRWVEGRATPEPMPDESIMWHGYIADIDDAKRLELALQESEARFRRLYELSPIGIALNDYLSGRFLDVNEALLRPTGYRRDQLMLMDYLTLLSEEHRSRGHDIIGELKAGNRFGPHEVDILREDGSTYPALVRGLRIDSPSGQALIWTLIEDISEQKKVDRMKSEFISTVSHELRTPLTSITGSLGLIESGSLGEFSGQISHMISIAYRNSLQLRELVDDLLDMEKLVSGKMRIQMVSQPVLPTVLESVDRLAAYATGSGVFIEVAENFSASSATFDDIRLGQAFTNLLSNAIKFSPDNAVVRVESEERDGHLRILVRDQGPGIPESFFPRVFHKFAQADSSDTRGKRGTGLGLAITREIMAQMGGGVGFESAEGEGSTFWLELGID